MIKKQVGNVEVRYRGQAKNTEQLKTLFMLNNLWMVCCDLMAKATERQLQRLTLTFPRRAVRERVIQIIPKLSALFVAVKDERGISRI